MQCGDRVRAKLSDGQSYEGVVKKVYTHQPKVQVLFDDGDILSVLLKDVTILTSIDPISARTDVFMPRTRDTGGGGFQTYPVTWSKDRTAFEVKVKLSDEDAESNAQLRDMIGETIVFHGNITRTKGVEVHAETGAKLRDIGAWVYSIAARLDKDGVKDYLVEAPSPIFETAGDPRGSRVVEMNRDICFAINRWIATQFAPHAIKVKQLEKLVEAPIIRAPSLDWLDMFIARLQECRTTSLRSGGERMCTVKTDSPHHKQLSIVMNFHGIAAVTGGKSVPAMQGRMLEVAAKDGLKAAVRSKSDAPFYVPDKSNVSAMANKLKELNQKAKDGDVAAKREASKLRAAMRKMGLKGGARVAAP
jgi:hypothetical protein